MKNPKILTVLGILVLVAGGVIGWQLTKAQRYKFVASHDVQRKIASDDIIGTWIGEYDDDRSQKPSKFNISQLETGALLFIYYENYNVKHSTRAVPALGYIDHSTGVILTHEPWSDIGRGIWKFTLSKDKQTLIGEIIDFESHQKMGTFILKRK